MLAGTRGAPSRASIVRLLEESPRNANQLAEALAMDYSTVKHHLSVLEKSGVVFPSSESYGRTYHLTPRMRDALPLMNEWRRADA